MKRMAVCFGIILVTIISCDNNRWEDSVITNNSSYAVSFKFNHTETRRLAVGESTSFETAAHQHLESYLPHKRVLFAYESTNTGYTGTFIDGPSWKVRINNTTKEAVTLSTSDWFDNDGKWIHWYQEDGEWKINDTFFVNTWMDIIDTVNPGAYDNDDSPHIIYTNTPVFIVTEPGSKENPPEAIGVAHYNIIGTTLWVTISTFP